MSQVHSTCSKCQADSPTRSVDVPSSGWPARSARLHLCPRCVDDLERDCVLRLRGRGFRYDTLNLTGLTGKDGTPTSVTVLFQATQFFAVVLRQDHDERVLIKMHRDGDNAGDPRAFVQKWLASPLTNA